MIRRGISIDRTKVLLIFVMQVKRFHSNFKCRFSFRFFFKAYRGDLQTLLDAFKRGVPVDITDKFMKTPLMVGLFFFSRSVFSLLNSFFFFLRLACAHGDLKTVQFLLTCG